MHLPETTLYALNPVQQSACDMGSCDREGGWQAADDIEEKVEKPIAFELQYFRKCCRMAQLRLDFTTWKMLCETFAVPDSNTGSAELMLHDTGTMHIIERASPQAGATFCHLGIGLKSFTNFFCWYLIASFVTHNRTWTQDVVIGDVGQ